MRSTPAPVEGLVVAGLSELALGALVGWPVSLVVPDPPRAVAAPLAIGAWTNANAFGVLAFRPELKDHPAYRASVIASFIATTWGFTGLASVAWQRWRAGR